MNIYSLSKKDFIDKKRDFYKTYYGKKIVYTYFMVPFLGMLVTVELLIQVIMCYFLLDNNWCRPLFLSWLMIPLIIAAIFTLIAYVVAYKLYFSELKEYINSLKNEKNK